MHKFQVSLAIDKKKSLQLGECLVVQPVALQQFSKLLNLGASLDILDQGSRVSSAAWANRQPSL